MVQGLYEISQTILGTLPSNYELLYFIMTFFLILLIIGVLISPFVALIKMVK